MHRRLHLGRVVPLGSPSLRRDALSEAFCEKLYLLSYETLTSLELYLDLWYVRTVDESFNPNQVDRLPVGLTRRLTTLAQAVTISLPSPTMTSVSSACTLQ